MSDPQPDAEPGVPEPPTETGHCPVCAADNSTSARYCQQCGVRLMTGGLDELDGPASKRAGSTAAGDVSNVRPHADSGELPIADPLIGTIVAGRYRIIEPLGRGGMGVVYRVEHARIGKLMALKLLTGELSRDPEIVARFKREALMVSRLSHPNTVQVFDFGVSEGLTYLAMEYLRGNDLGHIIRRDGPLAPERCAKVMIQVASSLTEAHGLGIVHRDLKPENIFLLAGSSGADVVKVLDFGLAKLRESSELGEVTSRGAIVGTPYYMSPEQIRGEAADPRSDIYSLGALMYAALTGEPVFDAPRPMGVLTKHLTDTPVSPSVRFPDLGVPLGLAAIVMRALEKDPARRFQTVQELQFSLISELRSAGATSSVELLLDSGQLHALTRSTEDAATRDEVERYERKLRRRGLAWTSLGLLAAGGVAAGVAWMVLQRTGTTRGFDGQEHEPNNAASEATPYQFGEVVRGQIGQRLDAARSDRDFYRVRVPDGTRYVQLRLSGLPNMALCAYVYRSGLESPIGRYCSGTNGQPLEVRALELQPGEHLVGVMQDRDLYLPQLPAIPVLENVSDAYELRLGHTEANDGAETEPNDTERDAAQIAIGQSFRGRLAWMRDVDFVCATPEAGKVRFVVSDGENGARPQHAVLQVTPKGGPSDGIPVRVHRQGVKFDGPAKHDVTGAWRSPAVDRASGGACLELRLVPNPYAPAPVPSVAPASNDEYVVRVEASGG